MSDGNGMLREIRDDIKTLLVTSAKTGQRVEHMEEELDELTVKVDCHSQDINLLKSGTMSKGDCDDIRNVAVAVKTKRQVGWVGVLSVLAAFLAASAAIASVVRIGAL